MAEVAITRLARRIARNLFTSGNGVRAEYLKLFYGDRYLGGWGERPLADQVEHILTQALIPKKAKRPKK